MDASASVAVATARFRSKTMNLIETFVTIAPTFVADSFPENKRGRIFGIFYLAIPVGTAAGYLLGGHLGATHGWRYPFYIAAFPGFLLALAVWFLPEPPRGQFDSQKGKPAIQLGLSNAQIADGIHGSHSRCRRARCEEIHTG